MSIEDTIREFWKTLSARNYERAKTFLADDCIYYDDPVGPAAAARGPEDAMKRLRIAWDALSHYENHDGLLLTNGTDVMYEHSETWVWPTGERATLPFVSVHRVRDGRITLWKDYWDMGTLANQAPPTWMDDLAKADTSWMFDATGLV